MKRLDKGSGILLHPTSLPSKWGIGDMGAGAREFVDFLAASEQRYWQILPLNPVGYGNSPYQCFSAFAGNHWLISLEELESQGLLAQAELELEQKEKYPSDRAQFDLAAQLKEPLLRKAKDRFFGEGGTSAPEYQHFVSRNRYWLDDYCFFMALKKNFSGQAWSQWPRELVMRQQQALEHWREQLQGEIDYHYFLQYQFFSQWQQIKEYAEEKGISIIGDIPIFVAYDSSDVWANPHLFKLNQDNLPTVVAGVPPDYFSETGQLWGNPHYRWDVMKEDKYSWWRQRFEQAFSTAQIVRIDHFRGFESSWEVPWGEETAVNGHWVKGPGAEFFKELENQLGKMNVIAEDLGIITEEVNQMRAELGYPGMGIIHFLMEGGPVDLFTNLFAQDKVIYTGTHDNDTTWGWYSQSLEQRPQVIKLAQKYFQIEPTVGREDLCWRMLKMAFESSASMVIVPLQDVLALGTEARMNTPGTVGDNWHWRYDSSVLTGALVDKLKRLTRETGRGGVKCENS
ncbi:4-alpha-glucanotransferase [Desulfitispora alkaliphila]|uniref:4-alpha-glucanotransferase n=1 Tax=Desulfitispora alkaliphila TaxID=622674 RepID=UPI003D1CE5A3